jgi:hypothetical protein
VVQIAARSLKQINSIAILAAAQILTHREFLVPTTLRHETRHAGATAPQRHRLGSDRWCGCRGVHKERAQIIDQSGC